MKKPKGRTPKPEQRRKQISLRLAPEIIERLEEAETEQKKTKTALIEEAISAHLPAKEDEQSP